MLYKLQEGLDEEGLQKLNLDLERVSRKIQHPLAVFEIKHQTVPIQKTESVPQKKERTPPPGWKSEKEAFNSAMAVMGFVGKRR